MAHTATAARRREPMPGLRGKGVLVTGGTSGIGQAMAVRFAEHGADVAINYRSRPDEASETEQQVHACVHQVRQQGVHHVLVQGDVANEDDVAGMVEHAIRELGELDVLVNNAGVTRDGLLVRMSDDDWETVIDTNLASCFFTSRAAVRGMMKRRSGSIVNISSIVGIHGNWGQTNYAASKAGIIGFTKALARELGSRSIRANVVVPGYVKSRLTDVLPESATAAMLDSTPLGRLGDPGDVAGAVRFLCSDEASFVTGAVLLVDGGLGM